MDLSSSLLLLQAILIKIQRNIHLILTIMLAATPLHGEDLNSNPATLEKFTADHRIVHNQLEDRL